MKRIAILVAGLMAQVAVLAAGAYPLSIESVQEEQGVWALVVHNAGGAPVYINLKLKDRVNVRVGSAGASGQKAMEPGAKETVILAVAERPEEPMSFNYEMEWVFGRGTNRGEHAGLYRPPFPGDLTFETNNSSGADQVGPNRLHEIDILMPEGTPVVAARAGWVMDVVGAVGGDKVKGVEGKYDDLDAMGSFVRIYHEDGTWAEYLHLKPGSVTVKVGQKVEAGTQLGESGRSGAAKAPHLAFAIMKPQGGFSAPKSIPFKMEMFGRGIVEVKAGDAIGASLSTTAGAENTMRDPLVVAAVKKGHEESKALAYSIGGVKLSDRAVGYVAGVAGGLAIAVVGVLGMRARQKHGSWKALIEGLRQKRSASKDGTAESIDEAKGALTDEQANDGAIDLRPRPGYLVAAWEESFLSSISLALPVGYSVHQKLSLHRLVARAVWDAPTAEAVALLRASSVDFAIVRASDWKIACVFEVLHGEAKSDTEKAVNAAKERLLSNAGIRVYQIEKTSGVTELRAMMKQATSGEVVGIEREATTNAMPMRMAQIGQAQ